MLEGPLQMRIILPLGFIGLLAACSANTADYTGANADWTRSSSKPVTAITGCIADNWGQYSSQISSIPKSGGYTLILMGGPADFPQTDAVVSVTATSGGSTVQYGGRLRGLALSWIEGSVTKCL